MHLIYRVFLLEAMIDQLQVSDNREFTDFGLGESLNCILIAQGGEDKPAPRE
jgi:hypothetical protein